MQIKCKENNPNNVPEQIPNNFNFGLILDKEYLVMGISITDNQIWYLIDEGNKPSFYPSQIFEITDHSLGFGWYFKLLDQKDDTYPFKKKAFWGYYELCLDENHYTDLLLREENALEIYFKRKSEMKKNSEYTEYFTD